MGNQPTSLLSEDDVNHSLPKIIDKTDSVENNQKMKMMTLNLDQKILQLSVNVTERKLNDGMQNLSHPDDTNKIHEDDELNTARRFEVQLQHAKQNLKKTNTENM